MRVITVPQEISEYLEFLSYETNALQDLLVRMSFFDTDIKTELQNYWTDRYINTYTEYELAKKELEKEYIQSQLDDNECVDWKLNFDSCEVVIQ